jgi:acetyltransferase-like isoleucine patch superfamily enzyme
MVAQIDLRSLAAGDAQRRTWHFGRVPEATAEDVEIPQGRAFHCRLWLTGLLFKLVPPFVLNRQRILALRICGVSIGRSTNFWGIPTLIGPGKIASRLRIGSLCGFNFGCLFELSAPVTIGNRVSVGHDVRFLTQEPARPEGVGRAAPIVVGDGAWIGARCTILAGVTIGAGVVVGAGVTVAKDVPPQTLVTGSQTVSLARWR